MKIKLILMSLILISMGLTGCASLNSNFDCPMKPGVRCESLDEVNAQVDQGLLGNPEPTNCKNCRVSKDNHSFDLKENTALPPSLIFTNNLNDPIRNGETTLRIWIAPYEDKEGNYYQPTMLYTVVKRGFWMGQPVKAISNTGDNT